MHARQEKEQESLRAESITVLNPATGEPLYDFAPATRADCRAAMTRARQACLTLRDVPMAQRLEALDALLAYLESRQEWLLDRIVAESGRSRGDAMLSDIFQLTEDCLWLRHHAAKALADESVPTPITLLGKQCHALRIASAPALRACRPSSDRASPDTMLAVWRSMIAAESRETPVK